MHRRLRDDPGRKDLKPLERGAAIASIALEGDKFSNLIEAYQELYCKL